MIINIIKKLTPLFIKNFLRRVLSFLTWDPWVNYSYSQEGEDMILKRIFENKIGFYIDVGAHHPKRFSNTHLLYKKGCPGIIPTINFSISHLLKNFFKITSLNFIRYKI